MKRRIFNTLSLISAILLACTIFLGIWNWTDPRKDCLSLGNEFHVAVQYGRVNFFNVKYRTFYGSIISQSSTKASTDRVFAIRQGVGDTLGIYYHYSRSTKSGKVLWTLSVSLVYPLILFAVLPTIWARRRWRAGRLRGDHEEMHCPRQQMLTVVGLYWWMGVLGAAAYLIAAITICLVSVIRAEFPSAESVVAIVSCCFFAAVFGTSIHVAHRLATRPDGMLHYARLVAIVLATVWFPILTIPGIICVRRLTKHFAAHCESVRTAGRSEGI